MLFKYHMLVFIFRLELLPLSLLLSRTLWTRWLLSSIMILFLSLRGLGWRERFFTLLHQLS